MLFNWLIVASWGVFVLFWSISALSAKRTLNKSYARTLWWRLAVVAFIIVFFNYTGVHITSSYHPTQLISWIGVTICALGVALAVWARVYLASNWGMPMSVKANPELITTGPYAYIRHPIYTGVLLGMFGSALVIGPFWAIVIVFGASYFMYSAFQEQKLMLNEFPNTYPAYMARTKMLVPFIF